MKIATWNVNSIRVRAEQVVKWLGRSNADVICLQELKTPGDEFPYELFAEAGYNAAVAGERTYNGVAVLSRHKIEEYCVGMTHLGGDNPLNSQKRLLTAKVGGVKIISAFMNS